MHAQTKRHRDAQRRTETHRETQTQTQTQTQMQGQQTHVSFPGGGVGFDGVDGAAAVGAVAQQQVGEGRGGADTCTKAEAYTRTHKRTHSHTVTHRHTRTDRGKDTETHEGMSVPRTHIGLPDCWLAVGPGMKQTGTCPLHSC